MVSGTAGYEPVRENVVIRDGDEVVKSYQLKADFATLAVISEPSGAEVSLNGTLLGKTPLNESVAATSGMVRLSLAGYHPLEFEVTLVRGQTVTIGATEAKLVARVGSLMIMVDPPEAGIKIFLDGVEKGTAPLTLDKVAVGPHEIKAEGKELGGTAPAEVSDREAGTVTVALKKRGVAGMVFVKGGCFQMGSDNGESDEKPTHRVCVDDFYLGKYEVTQAEWQAVMVNDSFRSSDCLNCPVEVYWIKIQEFIDKLNSRTDQHYRLPTEAEWEFAARGGENTLHYTYSGSNELAEAAWFRGSSNTSKAHPVGKLKPNELGLYDMSGNVWEWVQDYYDPAYYRISIVNNPHGPSIGSDRIIRGCCWYSELEDCRLTNRHAKGPGSASNWVGFRLAHSAP
jgi:formylglycine-generating enzyme required for sulfatase activity